jgi:DNA-binding transcriptional regulator of glucitol operon
VARFLTPRWLVRHALVLVLVPAFLALGWWQIDRARNGNALSLGYAVEWPLFAAFVVFVWVKEIRRELGKEPAVAAVDRPEEVPDELARQPGYVPFRVEPRRPRPGEAGGAGDDPDLVAYNRYLEWLAANPGRRPHEYPRSEG